MNLRSLELNHKISFFYNTKSDNIELKNNFSRNFNRDESLSVS